ncbi:hypothetical protein [Paenibacillus terrae]|nr:hypothetical protein [Paenibacillus terrae]
MKRTKNRVGLEGRRLNRFYSARKLPIYNLHHMLCKKLSVCCG